MNPMSDWPAPLDRPAERIGQATYGANAIGVVILDVVPQGRVAGVPPRPERCLPLVGLRVAGRPPLVVEAEGDPVARVQEAAAA